MLSRDKVIDLLIVWDRDDRGSVTCHMSTARAAYRKGLEDACGAICGDCADNEDIEFDGDWHHPGTLAECEAGPIHDKLAALDEEEKPEAGHKK